MENSSGGFMSDLTFNRGVIGAFVGNQQFTSSRMVFNGCSTAVVMNFNWLWTFTAITINNYAVESCQSQITTPAMIYVPPGTYVINHPIIMYYFTQLVSDAVTPPTLKVTSIYINVIRLAVLDINVYIL
jgi:hypothetical protein